MAITFRGSASTPTDAGAQAGPTVAVTPVGSCATGDLVVLVAQYRGTGITLTMSETSGQTWNTEDQSTNTSVTLRVFWCRFNGTWGSDPSVTIGTGTAAMTVGMHVFPPDNSADTWALEAPESVGTFEAPSTPFTVTITGTTTTSTHTATVAIWATPDDNTWGTLSGSGWSKTSVSAQYRNTTGLDQSYTLAYNIRSSAGSVADVSQNQATLGGDAGAYYLITFAEVAEATPASLAFTRRDLRIVPLI